MGTGWLPDVMNRAWFIGATDIKKMPEAEWASLCARLCTQFHEGPNFWDDKTIDIDLKEVARALG